MAWLVESLLLEMDDSISLDDSTAGQRKQEATTNHRTDISFNISITILWMQKYNYNRGIVTDKEIYFYLDSSDEVYRIRKVSLLR